jgi:hypothetical protein
MIKVLASYLLLTIAATSVRGIRLELSSLLSRLMKVGLDMDGESSPLDDRLCFHLSLTRGLKYDDNQQNVLDVATRSNTSSMTHPVLLFVTGQSFENSDTSADWAIREKATAAWSASP